LRRTGIRLPSPADCETLPASMSTQRLFVALTLPDAVRGVLASTGTPIPGVSWTRPEQLHVTLRFLGDVAADQQKAVLLRLATVRVEPFILPVEGLSVFPPPNRPPSVLWIGVGSGHPRLFQLRQRLDDALIAAGLQLDVRLFHPHVTLGRATEDAAKSVAHWLHVHREFSAPPFRVESFELYSSELHPSGASHTLIRSFPLTSKP